MGIFVCNGCTCFSGMIGYVWLRRLGISVWNEWASFVGVTYAIPISNSYDLSTECLAYLFGISGHIFGGVSGHICSERVVISVWDESAYLFGMSGHMCLG